MKTVRKPWGVTRHLHRGRDCETHHASVEAGGVSSYGAMHRHRRKWNKLYVVSGALLLFTEDDPGGMRLGPGQEYNLAPDEWHRFEALTPVELIETYWSFDGQPVDPEDIERQGQGGGNGPGRGEVGVLNPEPGNAPRPLSHTTLET